jgi:hypothetical protein
MPTTLLLQNVLMPLGVFAMVVLLVWIDHRSKRTALTERAELRKHFLDKFGSGRELTEFLATPQGGNFLKEQEMGQRPPKEHVIRSIRGGIVIAGLGCGFLGLLHFEWDLIYPGILLLALGVGLLIAAAVSYRLYKKWGMLQ